MVKEVLRPHIDTAGCRPEPPRRVKAPALSGITPSCVAGASGGHPVCGGGFKGNLAKMVSGGLDCLAGTKPPYTRCPHYWYRTGEPVAVTLKTAPISWSASS